MKTITEYQPMIFSQLAAHAEKRRNERRQFVKNAVMVTVYSAISLGLIVDTGCAPWTWPFWAMFGPLFIAGELASHALLPK